MGTPPIVRSSLSASTAAVLLVTTVRVRATPWNLYVSLSQHCGRAYRSSCTLGKLSSGTAVCVTRSQYLVHISYPLVDRVPGQATRYLECEHCYSESTRVGPTRYRLDCPSMHVQIYVVRSR